MNYIKYINHLILLLLIFTSSYSFSQCWENISLGVDFSTAVKTDGTLWTWGANEWGTLGNGNYDNVNSPSQIDPETSWKQISSQHGFTLAIKADGTLWGWGTNNAGQMGIENSVSSILTPTQIGLDSDWFDLSVGWNHVLAIKQDGSLWAWGNNTDGQLGNGNNEDTYIPTQVNDDNHWKYIAAGKDYSIAIKENGTLWSWGDNEFGQLGEGTAINRNIPLQVGVEEDWKFISTGRNFSLAIKENGTLWAWGVNQNGQLGDESNTDHTTPIQIGTENDWLQASAGYAHSQAIKKDGSLWAWGYNSRGLVGDGTRDDRNVPVKIGSDTDWSMIEAGGSKSSALKKDGTLWMWGRNVLEPVEISCQPVDIAETIPYEFLEVYPNPTQEYITIRTSVENKINLFFEVRNSMGQIVLAKQRLSKGKTLDVQALPKGFYFVRIVGNKYDFAASFFKF